MPVNRANRRIPVIGITGSIGSGKSALADCFAKLGATVISGDKIGHELLEKSSSIRRRLAAAFGESIIQRGSIRRDRLADAAFASRESLHTLNRITHPALIRELNRRVKIARRDRKSSAVIIDAALLAEWGIGRVEWDYLIGVWAPADVRRGRLRRRGWTTAKFSERSRLQMPWSERRALVDCVVKNDSTLTVLERRARLCWTKLLS